MGSSPPTETTRSAPMGSPHRRAQKVRVRLRPINHPLTVFSNRRPCKDFLVPRGSIFNTSQLSHTFVETLRRTIALKSDNYEGVWCTCCPSIALTPRLAL